MISQLHDFTRGGQTTLHHLRMLWQIVRKLILLFLIVFLLFMGYWLKSQYPHYRYPLALFKTYVIAQLQITLGHENDAMVFVAPQGETYETTPSAFIENPWVNDSLEKLKQAILKECCLGAGLALSACVLTILLLIIVGQREHANRMIRGTLLVSPQQLKRLLRKARKASDITLANVPLIEDAERAHFLLMGTPGTGKSVCMQELLDQVRAKKQRAIVYDKVGDFVAHYYRPDKDILLNPLDERCPAWNVWAECRDATDYDALATSLMPLPLSTGDTFWINAARTIFAATARRMENMPHRSTQQLLQFLLTADLETLNGLLRGTEAETLVSEKIEKTALSVKSVLATHLKSLVYLTETENPFSIRRWIEHDDDDSWLFIASRADKHESLKPLISTWLNIAGTALMSLTPDSQRRIWMSLDELPSLHRLPYLSSIFAESRKFGGCLIAAIQSIAQLREIYGNHAAEAISGLCNTRLFFRTPETQTAEWVSKSLGECEVDESREGFSYGANTMRDGVSLQRQTVIRPIVMPSEIMQLPNLQAYLRLPGNWPVTRLIFQLKNRVASQPAFIERSVKSNLLTDVESLVRKDVSTASNVASRKSRVAETDISELL